MHEILDTVAALTTQGEPFALATVVETDGSVSAKSGSKAVIETSGNIAVGWIGGGCAESAVRHAALESLQDGQTRMIDIDLDDEVLGVGMPCGGSMRVYVEPVLPQPALWILGHGRIAEALCRFGGLLGFRVVVIDEAAEAESYPDASQRITDDLDYSALTPRADDYVVVATQHKGDHQSMKRLMEYDVRYIALIASRKRTGLIMDFLREQGFDETRLAQIFAPAGLDLECRTPEEVALSVLAEIVMVRRGGSGRPMRQRVTDSDNGPAASRHAG